ncbi:MAG: alpha/beta hydrolase [Proteobacteria bacterium]|nr:alpha/beta hydrolase [Pseudomonadota bacterium]
MTGHIIAFLAFTSLAFLSCAPKVPQTKEHIVTDTNLTTFINQNGNWIGSSHISENTTLDFNVSFSVKDNAVSGTMSIPAQNAYDVPLDDIALHEGTFSFILKPPSMPKMMWAKYEFPNATSSDSLEGTLKQMGKTFPTTLNKGANPKANRPQTPQPPFPYTSKEVTYTTNDNATIAGTLTIPEEDGPHPVVILITGSGSQDRDETIFEHKPFWVIADHLSRNGIAVLRVDDRGIGGSTGIRDDLTSFVFAEDVGSGLDFLKAQPEVDSQKMGLIGHSEGGLIGPIVASQRSDVAFLVLLAGTGVNGLEVLTRQNVDLFRTKGMNEEQEQKLKEHFTKSMSPNGTREDLLELIQLQFNISDIQASPEIIEQHADSALKAKNQPWMQTFLNTEPSEYLNQITVPVLALNGTKDLQVAHDQNLPSIEQALKNGGNQHVTIHTLDGLNHMFQMAEVGTVEEYAQIEETFNPQALNIISDWISEIVSQEMP